MKIPSLATLVTAAALLSGCTKWTQPILEEQVKETSDMIHSILTEYPSGTGKEVKIGDDFWTIDVNGENGVCTGAKVTRSYDVPTDYPHEDVTCSVEVTDENGDGTADMRRFYTLWNPYDEEANIVKKATREDQYMFMDGLRKVTNTESK